MRSVNNKSDDLLKSTSASIYDVIIMTETWLHPTQNSNEFLSAEYSSFRTDRDSSSVDKEKGGGVLIALKHEFDAEIFSTPEMTGLEAVCVKVSLTDCNVFIYCLYIQPTPSDLNIYNRHVTAIESIEKNRSAKDIVLYCGDFNLPDVKWILNDDETNFLPSIGDSISVKAESARNFTNKMLELGLFQICNFKNISGNVLDLFYTTCLS